MSATSCVCVCLIDVYRFFAFLGSMINRVSYFKQIKFITEYTKVKHTNITTIYNDI
jgi:hypothetical protein